jgi:hypothetical protein
LTRKFNRQISSDSKMSSKKKKICLDLTIAQNFKNLKTKFSIERNHSQF